MQIDAKFARIDTQLDAAVATAALAAAAATAATAEIRGVIWRAMFIVLGFGATITASGMGVLFWPFLKKRLGL